MNLEFAADVFENHALAAGVGHDVMDRRNEAHILLHDVAHEHALGGGNGFLHVSSMCRAETSRVPTEPVPCRIFGLHVLILGGTRESKTARQRAPFH